jgi:hypothetical protein
MTWNYYGYNSKGQASDAIPGLAAIPYRISMVAMPNSDSVTLFETVAEKAGIACAGDRD